MTVVKRMAPSDDAVVEYDRRHLALYAALLDAAAEGEDWQEAAGRLMGIDVDKAGAEACWHSHLDRARWITGPGLGKALEAFD